VSLRLRQSFEQISNSINAYIANARAQLCAALSSGVARRARSFDCKRLLVLGVYPGSVVLDIGIQPNAEDIGESTGGDSGTGGSATNAATPVQVVEALDEAVAEAASSLPLPTSGSAQATMLTMVDASVPPSASAISTTCLECNDSDAEPESSSSSSAARIGTIVGLAALVGLVAVVVGVRSYRRRNRLVAPQVPSPVAKDGDDHGDNDDGEDSGADKSAGSRWDVRSSSAIDVQMTTYCGGENDLDVSAMDTPSVDSDDGEDYTTGEPAPTPAASENNDMTLDILVD